ncbi:glycogen/starch/alpha-glucan family phosphorylase [[Clostridium] innocuum]|nr:glycogen/starch/alpha-glucan family phosphorylase [[Clostridium] innocuum]
MTVMRQELLQDIRTMAGNKADASTLYKAIHTAVKKQMAKMETIVSKRKLYYISAEFLLGKMLTSNLIHLQALQQVQTLVMEYGVTWKEIEDVECEPSLGNGGLGRLAACFLDSIAELGLSGDGIGLYYHFGLFEQKFQNRKQMELPNAWIDTVSWFERIPVDYQVHFKNCTLQPVRYDMDVIGYDGKKNRLHLFDVESVDEGIVHDGISFDKRDIAHNLTLFLYPDDSDEAGRLLRIYQQYFMVSCAAHMILEEQKQLGHDLHTLYEHAVIQINDTHPSLIIPELIHQLMQEGICMKEAVRIVEKTCAYTNHTILAEALETWPMSYLETVVPHLTGILHALDTAADQRDRDAAVALIDADNRMHMAHMDIHFGKSVNGVAALHTEILKQSELHAFYKLYPEKFNNKTNGITFTRWLHACNTQLYDYLMELLQMDNWQDDQLHKLMEYAQDETVIARLLDIKQEKKREWCAHIKAKQGMAVNPNSVFDTQVKRLHEYKRQQMNALWIIYKMKEIRKGNLPSRPVTCIFGAKAAPAYTIAKDIIHVLLCLQDIIANDPRVSPYLQLCFIENYNVSEAEQIIPASDISEQISLASKEASGTGNMKFMLNGAVTLGTRDGANVEIADLVKQDNIYIFGKSSEEVIAHYEKSDYCSREYYEQDPVLHELVDYLVDDEMLHTGDPISLRRFYEELLHKDWFMTLLDTRDYIACKEQMLKDYEQRKLWGRRMLHNIACSGFFSSKRTIEDYNRDIWNLG